MALENTSPQVANDQLVDTKFSYSAFNALAPVAGGNPVPAFDMGTTNLGVFFGSGVPTISAPQGSLYLRTDGSSTSTRMYVNTNGTTGWTAVTTAT